MSFSLAKLLDIDWNPAHNMTPKHDMQTFSQILSQSLRLLCLVILRRRSRFVDYNGRFGLTIFRYQTLFNYKIENART